MTRGHRETFWTKDKVDFLMEWWPHFGTYYCADALKFTRPQIKSKVDKLRLHILPKEDRLCVECRENYQVSRRYGLLCRNCHLKRRKKVRSKELPFESWILDTLRTLRYRSKGHFNLTPGYMKELWEQQNGKCFYSGVSLLPPTYGRGRRPFTASVDRIDSSIGYEIGNIVWSTWICNVGKLDLSTEDYINICRCVVENHSLMI